MSSFTLPLAINDSSYSVFRKVTTNSPRRSQYNGLLISPTTGTAVPASAVTSSSTVAKVPGKSSSSHHLTPTYVRSTGASFSSLKRVKNVPLYSSSHVKSSPSSTIDNRSIYATYGRVAPQGVNVTTPTTSLNPGQYRSPSRILLESGYLTLPNNTTSNHHHQGKDHVYENLYSSPNNNTTTNTVDVPDSSPTSKEKYMSNLRSSVQLKRSLPCANCSKPDSPSITTTSSSLDRKLYKSKSKDRKCPNCSGKTSGTSGKLSNKSSQLNQQVIWIKDEHENDQNKNGKTHDNMTTSNTNSTTINVTTDSNGKVVKRGKKKNKKRDWFLEVDPQRRFQFIQSTLIICNVFALLCGVIALIVAGFVDPRPSLTSFGGQLTIVSVYIILTSLTGLYGARRESVSLLVLYGCMIIASLFFRSLFYFIVTFVTSSATSIALSMLAAFLEVILIIFAFALASEVRLKKLDKKNKKEQNTSDHKSENNINDNNRNNNSNNENTGSKKIKSNNTTDRDIESASPVASAETDSTTSNVESTGIFNNELNSSGRFTSGSPFFPLSTLTSLNTILNNTTNNKSPTIPTPISPTRSTTATITNRTLLTPSSIKSNGEINNTLPSKATTTTTAMAKFTTRAQISPSSASSKDDSSVKTFTLTGSPLLASASASSSMTSTAYTRSPLAGQGGGGGGQANSLMTTYSMSISRSINSSSTLKGAGVRPAAYF